jgi:flagellar motility protein MotE (MotC chaperone)
MLSRGTLHMVLAVLILLALSLFIGYGPTHLLEASSDVQKTMAPTARTTVKPAPPTPSVEPPGDLLDKVDQSRRLGRPTEQGPALDAPREILHMLDQRKLDLDRREKDVLAAEGRLLTLKAELEEILTQYEKLVETTEKRRKEAKDKRDQTNAQRTGNDTRPPTDSKNVNHAQLVKIYESMPPEEAAARLEKMPDRKAVELLRLLKGKTAGAILSSVKADRAARLTEQLLTNP